MKQRMINRMMLIVTILLNPARLGRMEARIAKREFEKALKQIPKKGLLKYASIKEKS